MRILYIIMFLVGFYFLPAILNYINMSIRYQDPSNAPIIDTREDP